MGAIPNKLPGFQDIETDDEARGRFEAEWGRPIAPSRGWHLSEMFEECGRSIRALYVIGENPATSEADSTRAKRLLGELDFLVVQDIFMTKTAEMADVVLPASVSAIESEGTVTNSERRVQRVRRALDPPGNARDDMWIIAQLAGRLGFDWGEVTAESAWDELRSLSPMHRGMSYRRLEELGGIQWPCPDEDHPGTLFLHGRLWLDPPEQGAPAPFSVAEWDPPVDELTDEFPVRLTTGRRLTDFNTGVQTARFSSPLRRGESIDVSPEDAASLGVSEGERVCVISRRGSVEVPVHVDLGLRPGLTFMTLHFPDEAETNALTVDAWDPKSGTSEFKATAVRIERLQRTVEA
jgi:formate dehydrogenase major subunit